MARPRWMAKASQELLEAVKAQKGATWDWKRNGADLNEHGAQGVGEHGGRRSDGRGAPRARARLT